MKTKWIKIQEALPIDEQVVLAAYVNEDNDVCYEVAQILFHFMGDDEPPVWECFKTEEGIYRVVAWQEIEAFDLQQGDNK